MIFFCVIVSIENNAMRKVQNVSRYLRVDNLEKLKNFVCNLFVFFLVCFHIFLIFKESWLNCEWKRCAEFFIFLAKSFLLEVL